MKSLTVLSGLIVILASMVTNTHSACIGSWPKETTLIQPVSIPDATGNFSCHINTTTTKSCLMGGDTTTTHTLKCAFHGESIGIVFYPNDDGKVDMEIMKREDWPMNLKIAFQKKQAEKDAALKEWEGMYKNLGEELRKSNTEIKKLKADIKSLRKSNEEEKRQRLQVEAMKDMEIDKLKADNESLRKSNDEKDSKNNLLTKQNQEQKAALDKLKAEKENLIIESKKQQQNHEKEKATLQAKIKDGATTDMVKEVQVVHDGGAISSDKLLSLSEILDCVRDDSKGKDEITLCVYNKQAIKSSGSSNDNHSSLEAQE